jgi:hypothetical protein
MRPSFFLITLRLLAPALIASAADIKDCGDISSYKVAPYVALATELQALRKEDAIARLQKWATSRKYDEQIIILCRMLFEPRPGIEFRRPMLGDPQFYSETTIKDWPLEPITLVDGVPFLIVGGYVLAGLAEEGSSYLNYCLSNANWSSKQYRSVNKQEINIAFEKLLKSLAQKQPLSEWGLRLFTKQIE